MPDHTKTLDEKVLLARLSAGEESAFAEIYGEYAALLINYAASRLESLEEARDIVQDLFIYIWDERTNIRIDRSLRAYLLTAIRYRIIDYIRHRLTCRAYAARIMTLSKIASIEMEEEIAAKSLRLQLDNAVADLPSRTQEIFRLSRYRHLAVKEIACELGLSEQTVKNQLTTALSYLRIRWDKISILVLAWFFY